MYDAIIAKVLANPRIDKRTLLQKFISKIEMESNVQAGISEELSQIKQMISKQSSESKSNLAQNHKPHAVSQVEQTGPQMFDETDKALNEGAQSM